MIKPQNYLPVLAHRIKHNLLRSTHLQNESVCFPHYFWSSFYSESNIACSGASGPTDRNGNSALNPGKNDSLKLLAHSLSERGLSSVRFDKRGVGESASAGPNELQLKFEDYVQDVVAWVVTLSKDKRFSGVVILGHSEGSLIGMLAAQKSPALAFVSVAGSAEKAPLILRRQLRELLPLELAAQSDTDIQIAVTDAHALVAAKGQCQLKFVAGMNHVMKLVASERALQMASYSDPSLPISQDLISAITAFVDLKVLTKRVRPTV